MKIIKKILPIMMICFFITNIIGTLNTASAETIAQSINETFITEDNYEAKMKEVVEPYIELLKQTGYMDVGQDDFEIYYEKYIVPDSKASIVISHGYTESLEKYHEIIYYFLKSGYSVYGLEHRGHGRSGHLGKEDITQINIDNFGDYVSDFKQFLDEEVKPETGEQKLFLFAHSMGGAIGADFLEQYPDYFDSAVLSAPMLQVNTGSVPEWMANMIASIKIYFSSGDKYIMGKSAYSPDYNFEGSATGCEERYDYYHDIENNDTELQRGDGSYKWLKNALTETKKITSKEEASKVEIPVLLFKAGKDDYVKENGLNMFSQYAKDCKMVFVSEAKHEIYREEDSILEAYMKRILEFYSDNL
ncbi:MAG: alpha/beta hydrolase [Clostridium sp.]|nr:alpha/beta hydrolase [Clostridium sp.]